MAKKINGLRIVYTVVGLLMIGAGLVVTFTLQGASIASSSTRIVELKEEGCNPAEEVKDRVLVLETNYTHLEAGQVRIEKKMDTQHTVVLEALKAIKEK